MKRRIQGETEISCDYCEIPFIRGGNIEEPEVHLCELCLDKEMYTSVMGVIVTGKLVNTFSVSGKTYFILLTKDNVTISLYKDDLSSVNA